MIYPKIEANLVAVERAHYAGAELKSLAWILLLTCLFVYFYSNHNFVQLDLPHFGGGFIWL